MFLEVSIYSCIHISFCLFHMGMKFRSTSIYDWVVDRKLPIGVVAIGEYSESKGTNPAAYFYRFSPLLQVKIHDSSSAA